MCICLVFTGLHNVLGSLFLSAKVEKGWTIVWYLLVHQFFHLPKVDVPYRTNPNLAKDQGFLISWCQCKKGLAFHVLWLNISQHSKLSPLCAQLSQAKPCQAANPNQAEPSLAKPSQACLRKFECNKYTYNILAWIWLSVHLHRSNSQHPTPPKMHSYHEMNYEKKVISLSLVMRYIRWWIGADAKTP